MYRHLGRAQGDNNVSGEVLECLDEYRTKLLLQVICPKQTTPSLVRAAEILTKSFPAAHVFICMHRKSGIWMIRAALESSSRFEESAPMAMATLDDHEIFQKGFRCLGLCLFVYVPDHSELIVARKNYKSFLTVVQNNNALRLLASDDGKVYRMQHATNRTR